MPQLLHSVHHRLFWSRPFTAAPRASVTAAPGASGV